MTDIDAIRANGGTPRYGLQWNGPQQPVPVGMSDGYWTPWHLAEAERDALLRAYDAKCEELAAYIARNNRLLLDLEECGNALCAMRAERDIMARRADRVSLFLDAFSRLVGAGSSVMVPDEHVPESGVFTITAKARHVREFNAAMRSAIDADRPENELSLSQLRAERDAAVRDAARWRATVGCARVRVLGSAGLDQSTDPYAHIGIELWTRYDMEGRDCSFDRERMTQFADFAVALAPPTEQPQPSEREDLP